MILTPADALAHDPFTCDNGKCVLCIMFQRGREQSDDNDATFTWPCPICGHRNTEPMDGARIESATPCCGLPTRSIPPGKDPS